ncbi:hypothetical protein Tco_0483942 [Tanacetum coccineum]
MLFKSLKKYGLWIYCGPVDTPIVENVQTDEDKRNAVDPSHYRGMIARPTEKHPKCSKMIFRSCWLTRYSPLVLWQYTTFWRDRLVRLGRLKAEKPAISSTDAELLLCPKWGDRIYFVNTGNQLAESSTKDLWGRERIEFLINKLGMRSFTPDTLKQLADEVDE